MPTLKGCCPTVRRNLNITVDKQHAFGNKINEITIIRLYTRMRKNDTVYWSHIYRKTHNSHPLA